MRMRRQMLADPAGPAKRRRLGVPWLAAHTYGYDYGQDRDMGDAYYNVDAEYSDGDDPEAELPDGVELPARNRDGIELPGNNGDGVELPSNNGDGVDLPDNNRDGVDLPENSSDGHDLEVEFPESEMDARDTNGFDIDDLAGDTNSYDIDDYAGDRYEVYWVGFDDSWNEGAMDHGSYYDRYWTDTDSWVTEDGEWWWSETTGWWY